MNHEKLRKVDDKRLEELVSQDSGRRLCWRRSLNTIALKVAKPSESSMISVNDLDLSDILGGNTKVTGSCETVRRLAFTETTVGRLDNFIFYEQEEAGDLFVATTTCRKVQLTLRSAPPLSEDRGNFKSGSYFGIASAPNQDDAPQTLEIEATLPDEHLSKIEEKLKANPQATLNVQIYIDSYTFEVDDALREWYDPRTILICGPRAEAAVASIAFEGASESDTEDDIQPPIEALHHEAQPTQQGRNIVDVDAVIKIARSIRVALWVIAVALIFVAIK